MNNPRYPQDSIIKAYESTQTEHQWILEEENSCPLCGTELQFHHEIDPLTLDVQERSHCPSCHITTRTKTSLLQ